MFQIRQFQESDSIVELGYREVGWVQWPGKVYRSVVLSKPLLAAPL